MSGAFRPARGSASEPRRAGSAGAGRSSAGSAGRRLRVAVLGTFHFPMPQGSQVFAGEQAAALARAGAELTFFCYGGRAAAQEVSVRCGARGFPADTAPASGSGRWSRADETDTDAGFEIVRAPRLLAPRRTRAGPSAAKPFADAALAARLRCEHSRRPFDAVIAHNGEAACVALAARAGSRLPVIYAVHAILGRELPSYAPRAAAAAVSGMGAALDRLLARRCDGVIALAETSARALRPHARGPVAVIPPGLDPAPLPSPEIVERACARHALPLRGYAIYTGNLDRYQALEDLASAAARLPDVPVVVATHAPVRPSREQAGEGIGRREGTPAPLTADGGRQGIFGSDGLAADRERSRARDRAPASLAPARIVQVGDADEMRALLCGAAVALLPRRVPGGFPIKLLNYMEAGRAIVARSSVAEGLEHDRSAWLLPPDAGGAELAEAVAKLCAEPERAERLGRSARSVLETRHAWPALAARTLGLAEEVVARRARL